jgi:Ni/Fe-hydrogenase 1 B-type cytochrome subunit
MAIVRQRHWAEVNRPDTGITQVRVYVWELPVRVSHWLIVLPVAVLSFTGYYIHNPFIVARGNAAYVMGTMRLIHLVAGFVFIGAFILRIYWFFKGNHWSRWISFIPVHRRQWRGMGQMVKYYSFLNKNLQHHVGHNALAGITYTVMFVIMLLEILTGLAMYSQILGNRTFSLFIGWLPRLIDIQTLRLIHFFNMYLFFVFVIHHVYSAVLVSWEERNGLVESIFTGYKFVPEDELEQDEAIVAAEGEARLAAPGMAEKVARTSNL